MRKALRSLSLISLIGFALVTLAQEQPATEGAAELDPLFVQAAADGDMYEIASSEVVLEAAGDDQEVADLAQRIIDDHTANTERLTELAGAIGVEIPQQMSAGKQFKVEQLRALNATAGAPAEGQPEGQQEGGAEDEQAGGAEDEPAGGAEGEQEGQQQDGAQAGDRLIQAYLLQQELAHLDAITLYTAYAEMGQNEELRTFAQETLPVLQEHLEMVQSLRESRGTGGQ